MTAASSAALHLGNVAVAGNLIVAPGNVGGDGAIRTMNTRRCEMMTDIEYHEKMFRMNHSTACSWGWDQYWWECDCGAIPVDELRAEQKRRAAVSTQERNDG